jgi:hypothetical protein
MTSAATPTPRIAAFCHSGYGSSSTRGRRRQAQERRRLRLRCGFAGALLGDACEPLHRSVLANGHEDGRGNGSHSAYETAMMDHQAEAILEGFQAKLPDTTRPASVSSGHGAAVATVELMARAAENVDP